MLNSPRSLVSAALLSAFLYADAAPHWTKANAADVEAIAIRFQARVGEQPFRCDQRYGLGTPISQVTPLDFRFYVSDVALIDAAGNAVPLTLEPDGQWQYNTVALLDFEDKSGGCANGTVEMNDRIVGSVPPGDYVGLRFTLGLPFEINHADATLAPSPLNLTSLWWNWQAGYKFARIDFSPQHSAQSPNHSAKHEQAQSQHGDRNAGFAFHLGSTGCEITGGSPTPTRCSNPNRATVTLNQFDPSTNVVVADLTALVANTDLKTNQPNTPPGCMSGATDRDCSGIMSALGIPFNGNSNVNQTFFKVE
jgi:uncharacterized repeat protein (TIGR04052 family)